MSQEKHAMSTDELSIAILTTETVHHAYFVKRVAERFSKVRVFIDNRVLSAPFETAHDYEIKREAYEKEIWFGDAKYQLACFADCLAFENININAAKQALADYQADIYIVFGTGKIAKSTCECYAGRLVNLHGGDPEQYRGLDSHLWALYHRDKSGLITTLHEINSTLDDGNIINTMLLPLNNIKQLSHLRKENTEVCVQLVLNFLDDFKKRRVIHAFKQKKIGRYYSFMPTVLKEWIHENFNRGLYDELFK